MQTQNTKYEHEYQLELREAQIQNTYTNALRSLLLLLELVVFTFLSVLFSSLEAGGWGRGGRRAAEKKWLSRSGVSKKLKILAWVPLRICFFLGGTFRNVQFGTIRKVHYRNQNNQRLTECLFAKYMIGPPFAECSLNVNKHITFHFLNTILR